MDGRAPGHFMPPGHRFMTTARKQPLARLRPFSDPTARSPAELCSAALAG